MKTKKWIAGALSALAVGGLLAVSQPMISYAAENAPAVQNFQPGAGIGAAVGRLQGSMIDVISKLLGMDRTQLIQERQAGKSMVDIAETKGVDEQKLVDTIIDQRKSFIDQRLKDGQITEEQAQYCEDNMEQRIKTNLERTTVGPANGNRGRGMRGMGAMGGGRWQQQAPQTNQQ
jgi:hypothetical protein